MSDICPTVRIKPLHPSQGDFVEINAEDFDPAAHALFDLPPPPAPLPELPPPPPAPVGPLDNLPPNWRNKSPGELRTLAASATGRTPENKPQAIEMIEAALKESK